MKVHRYRSFVLTFLFLTSTAFSASPSSPKTKNIILLIGDGMGFNQIQLTYELTGQKPFFTSLPTTGIVFTSSGSQWVTDSAAAISAMVTGHKVKNHSLSISQDNQPLTTLVETFKKMKKKIGLVTTTDITDATPAGFVAHVQSRKEHEKIAEYIINEKADLLLGGGRKYFLPKNDGGKREDQRNLIEEAKGKGYRYISTASQLKALDEHLSAQKILGLFHKSDLDYMIDREELPEAKEEPTLSEMTKLALHSLSQEKNGFFLMIEGGRIDHACHQLDAATLAKEVVEFDKAVKMTYDFSKKNKDTLILVTADHETAGLTPTEATHHDYFRKREVSAQYMATEIRKNNFDEENIKKVLKQYAEISDLHSNDIRLIQNTEAEDEFQTAVAVGSLMARKGELLSISIDVIHVGNTHGHTSLPVPIFSFGPNANLFLGTMENTEIHDKILRSSGVAF